MNCIRKTSARSGAGYLTNKYSHEVLWSKNQPYTFSFLFRKQTHDLEPTN